MSYMLIRKIQGQHKVTGVKNIHLIAMSLHSKSKDFKGGVNHFSYPILMLLGMSKNKDRFIGFYLCNYC